MAERLVDVLNDRDTVLGVIPVTLEERGDDRNEADYLREALTVAADLHVVPDADLEGLHARMHVCRGGQLTPVGDVLAAGQEARERDAQQVDPCLSRRFSGPGDPGAF